MLQAVQEEQRCQLQQLQLERRLEQEQQLARRLRLTPPVISASVASDMRAPCGGYDAEGIRSLEAALRQRSQERLSNANFKSMSNSGGQSSWGQQR
jgi:hypothetical protein